MSVDFESPELTYQCGGETMVVEELVDFSPGWMLAYDRQRVVIPHS